ncbi:MAG: hypothetical protein JNG90_19020 [Planctomycetaceae bacterium]|nr:hypothetical protein [Planctomycetaceae bacterium]
MFALVAAGFTAWAQPGGPVRPTGGAAAVQTTGPGQVQRDEQSGMLALAAPAGDNRQLVTVIDPRTKVMTVYHIELSTGTIELKNARKIEWDLQMVEFNGTNPLPQDIRRKIDQLK